MTVPFMESFKRGWRAGEYHSRYEKQAAPVRNPCPTCGRELGFDHFGGGESIYEEGEQPRPAFTCWHCHPILNLFCCTIAYVCVGVIIYALVMALSRTGE